MDTGVESISTEIPSFWFRDTISDTITRRWIPLYVIGPYRTTKTRKPQFLLGFRGLYWTISDFLRTVFGGQ
jgi:hypothetical protein